MNQLFINVQGSRWKVKVISQETFDRIHSPKFVGSTDCTLKEIHLIRGRIDLGTVIHELFHAYVCQLHIDSASLRPDQFEEIIAEFLADRAVHFVKHARSIYTRLRKRRGKRNGKVALPR